MNNLTDKQQAKFNLIEYLRGLLKKGLDLTTSMALTDPVVRLALETITPPAKAANQFYTRELGLMIKKSPELEAERISDEGLKVWTHYEKISPIMMGALVEQENVKKTNQDIRHTLRRQELQQIATNNGYGDLPLFGDNPEINPSEYDSGCEQTFLEAAKKRGLELVHNYQVKNRKSYYKIDYLIKNTKFGIEIMSYLYHKYNLPEDYKRMQNLQMKGYFMVLLDARSIYANPDRQARRVEKIYKKWANKI